MKRLPWILPLFALLASPAAAQQAGQVGLVIKAQLIPQAGVAWQATNRIGLRALLYAEGGGDEVIDFGDASRLSIAALYRFPADDSLHAYFGVDFTASRFEDENYLGPLFGVQYQPHERFGLFGEFGVSVDVGDSVEIVSMFNTGAGVIFYFNR